jgi:hypothetical protein
MPVDEAALDAFLASDGETTAPAEPQADPAPATEATTEVEIPELPADQDKFDRAYVEKLRREAASYRDRSKKYQTAFDGYEEEAVQEWLTLAEALKTDPKAAAERFAELAEAINEQYKEPEPEIEDTDPELGDNKPLTKAEFERLWSEKAKEADLNQRVVKIEADAQGLGYEKGSERYDYLLWRAGRLPSGSIQEAHEHILREEQSIFDRKVQEMGGKPAPQVPADGTAPSGERKIRTFEEANEALDAWLANQF